MESATATSIVLKELAGNPPPHLNAIQTFLAPHVGFLTTLWISLWVLTAIALVIKLMYEYKEQKNKGNN